MSAERPLFSNADLVSEESRKRWRERLAFVAKYPKLLTDWEADFLRDMQKRMELGHDLQLGQGWPYARGKGHPLFDREGNMPWWGLGLIIIGIVGLMWAVCYWAAKRIGKYMPRDGRP